MKIQKCQHCKEETETTKVRVTIDLAREVAVDLTMQMPLCHKCETLLKTQGIQKMTNVRWIHRLDKKQESVLQ